MFHPCSLRGRGDGCSAERSHRSPAPPLLRARSSLPIACQSRFISRDLKENAFSAYAGLLPIFKPLARAPSSMQPVNFVGSIDQGTTSTRFIIWDRAGRIIACEQQEHTQILPKPGHVEHDAIEIWQRTQEVISRALASAGLCGGDLAAIGITNQRETTVAWDAVTGKPLYNALVWQDTRTQDIIDALDADAVALLRSRTGLRAATYFSGSKMKVTLACSLLPLDNISKNFCAVAPGPTRGCFCSG